MIFCVGGPRHGDYSEDYGNQMCCHPPIKHIVIAPSMDALEPLPIHYYEFNGDRYIYKGLGRSLTLYRRSSYYRDINGRWRVEFQDSVMRCLQKPDAIQVTVSGLNLMLSANDINMSYHTLDQFGEIYKYLTGEL